MTIHWNKEIYEITNCNNIPINKKELKFFRKEWEYEFTQINYLGEGAFGIVDSYYVTAISGKPTIEEKFTLNYLTTIKNKEKFKEKNILSKWKKEYELSSETIKNLKDTHTELKNKSLTEKENMYKELTKKYPQIHYIIAGKRFKKYTLEQIEQYILKVFYIKKVLNNKNYSLRILNIKHNKQKYVQLKNGIFSSKKENLSEMIFLKYLNSNDVIRVLPINDSRLHKKSRGINPELIKHLTPQYRLKIYKQIVTDIVKLWKNNLIINQFDLWIIAFLKNKDIEIYALDVDNIIINPYKNVNEYFQHLKIILYKFFESYSLTQTEELEDYKLIYNGLKIELKIQQT